MAATSGDIRRALHMCRRAVQLAKEADQDTVSFSYVKKAEQELNMALQVVEIKSAPLHEQIFLCALALASRCAATPLASLEQIERYQFEHCCPPARQARRGRAGSQRSTARRRRES